MGVYDPQIARAMRNMGTSRTLAKGEFLFDVNDFDQVRICLKILKTTCINESSKITINYLICTNLGFCRATKVKYESLQLLTIFQNIYFVEEGEIELLKTSDISNILTTRLKCAGKVRSCLFNSSCLTK